MSDNEGMIESNNEAPPASVASTNEPPVANDEPPVANEDNNNSANETVSASVQSAVASPLIHVSDQPLNGEGARRLSQFLIHKYFTTQRNPLTKHHLDSFDQFLQRDMRFIIASKNPLIILKNPKALRTSTAYKYRVEINIGGPDASEIFVGTPSLSLQKGQDIRILYPNEARLRNLTYAVPIEANVYVKIIIQTGPGEEHVENLVIEKMNLCNFPLMLHSQYCMLSGKPDTVLSEMGECPHDQGGYFIVGGSEKVLVTRQEGAFNTLWITPQPADENVEYYCSISSLNPVSREVRRVNFYWTREKTTLSQGFSKKALFKASLMEIQIPYVIKPIPIFILFRALGIQTDREIIQLIFPDFNNPETRYLADMLIPSINAAAPFLDTYSAIQYIKSLTKGFSEFHVLDILHNQLFPHVEDYPGARAAFLADCVKKILRVAMKLDVPPSRDDTRYQRCLTSGFLCQMLFQNVYKTYLTAVVRKVDETFNYNESTYSNQEFVNIFSEANRRMVFQYGLMTDQILRGFKGKWVTGNNHEEQGVIQELSRLSYLDFISHLRHAVLNFDTSMKLQGPRRLHPSQYGYYCTSETPNGSSIGITKNLTIMTSISTGMIPTALTLWLFSRGKVISSEQMTPQLASVTVPVYINSGLVGYTGHPKELTRVLRLMKRTGCLPPLSSSGFSIPERRIFIFTDEGRPLRPLICFHERGRLPDPSRFKGTWRTLVVGTLKQTEHVAINSKEFIDPLQAKSSVELSDYIDLLNPEQGVIEYIDPMEQNESFIANGPTHILPETTHMEVHPSTILGLLGNCIPYPNHNQSPRNQLSSSQSKQSVALYATNFKNRYDNTANILCYGEAPLSRTIYQDYFGDGKLGYGQNIILAMGMYGGYNQEDGIIMNADALARGQFRSINYRSYEAYEEDDRMAKLSIRIGNPKNVSAWLDLKPNVDYGHLDENGIVKVGTYVTQNTVIVGRYMMAESGKIKDASVTPQVWTRGRVESVVVTVNNLGFRLVKLRVTQDRIPELGDKFSNRHGQKGTLNVLYRGHDMPRTVDGITPDMIMNPTAIPSRMTIGQILEMIFGNLASELGAIANVTAFMNDGSPHEVFGKLLEEKFGLHKLSNQVLYNGMTGEQITTDIYMGVVYGMRIKHMTEDKWNARGQGRREMRTHQPTGGRGNEGGLKIGEMDRDAILGHGISSFLQESMMLRSDGAEFIVCNGCGTIPIYNEREGFYLCSLCDGPIEYSGNTANTLEPIPPPIRSSVTFSRIEIPYATKLFIQEMDTFANIGMRFLTSRDTMRLRGLEKVEELTRANAEAILSQPLKRVVVKDIVVAEAQHQPEQFPTDADIGKEFAKLQEQAVESFQKENAQPLALPLPLPLAPAEPALQPGPPLPLPLASAQPVLQPGSIAPGPPLPLPLPLPLPQPTEGLIITPGLAPVLNVDTSDAALAAAGLTAPAVAPSLAQPQPALSRRRTPKARQPAQQQVQQPTQQEEPIDEEMVMPQPQNPIKVVKLGS